MSQADLRQMTRVPELLPLPQDLLLLMPNPLPPLAMLPQGFATAFRHRQSLCVLVFRLSLRSKMKMGLSDFPARPLCSP